jgi:N-methylhydantoinase A
VSEPLGLTELEAAAGIIEVVNANMVGGIRSVSVERGIDPRGYLLVSGGGAGGLHAARLAHQLGMARVMIPSEASTFCAFGMTVTDVRHDYTFSHHALSTQMDISELDAPFAKLETEARERLRSDGYDDEDISLERSVDVRYRNQIHELTVPIPSTARYTEDHLQEIVSAFHAEHHSQFTYSLPDVPIEFLHWRIAAIAASPRLPRPQSALAEDGLRAGEAAPTGNREAYFPEHHGKVETPVYSMTKLVPRTTIDGHAIVESHNTTVVINPGDRLSMLDGGRLLIDVAVGS